MAEYIERQAAIYALDKEYRYGADIDRCGLAKAFKAIESLEPADVAPIVRCKDCQYLDTVDDDVGICHHVNGFGGVMPKDGFCSKGERET